MFGNHGLGGLLEEGAHEKSPKCLGGNLGDLGGILQRSQAIRRFCFKTDGFISDATISRIIERMGYKGRVTPHGFRALASSILNEQGFNPDAIERQLAHIENNKIRAAYNRADYLTERKEFMQWYGNFLWERYRQALKQIQSP